MAAGVFVVNASKANDRRPPHPGLMTRPFPHQLDQAEAVLSLFLLLHPGVDEVNHADGCFGCFVLGGHEEDHFRFTLSFLFTSPSRSMRNLCSKVSRF